MIARLTTDYVEPYYVHFKPGKSTSVTPGWSCWTWKDIRPLSSHRSTTQIGSNHFALCVFLASSAFAVKNYPGGRTTHYLCGIPVDLKSMVGPRSDRAKLLLMAKCHVIDEIGGLHFKAFACADRLMRSLTGCSDKV
jgi:hypothetical protein